MVGKFLNLEDEAPKIGAGLKSKAKKPTQEVNKAAIAETGAKHGFNRTTEAIQPAETPRRGRPPVNDEMTYWRIYISPSLREELNTIRDQEGRRLNDVLADMLDAYKKQNKS